MLQPIIGVILILLGALMFTNIQYWKVVKPFQRVAQVFKKQQPETGEQASEGPKKEKFYGKLFGYGMGYGAASAACVAPVFIAVILTAMVVSVFFGIVTLLLFSLTSALLMIVITVILAAVSRKWVDKLKQYTDIIKKISAAVLILVGVYFVAYFYYAWVLAK
jgi:cytochrome c biogenesis protein CcdA